MITKGNHRDECCIDYAKSIGNEEKRKREFFLCCYIFNNQISIITWGFIMCIVFSSIKFSQKNCKEQYKIQNQSFRLAC